MIAVTAVWNTESRRRGVRRPSGRSQRAGVVSRCDVSKLRLWGFPREVSSDDAVPRILRSCERACQTGASRVSTVACPAGRCTSAATAGGSRGGGRPASRWIRGLYHAQAPALSRTEGWDGMAYSSRSQPRQPGEARGFARRYCTLRCATQASRPPTYIHTIDHLHPPAFSRRRRTRSHCRCRCRRRRRCRTREATLAHAYRRAAAGDYAA